MDYMPHIAYNSHSPLADPRLQQHRNSNGASLESRGYDQKMAGIINATLEQGFKGDLNHVDHWFGLLKDTEQLAVVYTLLQHMSKDNARFFTHVLQQMSGDNLDSSPAGYMQQQQQQQQTLASRRLSHPVSALASNRFANDLDARHFHPLVSSDLFASPINGGRPRSVIEGSSRFLGSSAWGGGGVQTTTVAAGSAMSPSSSAARSSVGSIGDRRPRPQSVDVSAWTKRPDLTSAITNSSSTSTSSGASRATQERKECQVSSSSKNANRYPSPTGKNRDTSPTSSSSSSSQRGGGSLSSSATSKKPAEASVDMDQLKDVPGWFRSLRLHKYTSQFESLGWQEIIKMDDAQLEARGVAALGARRKMLKTFERVRAHCAANNIGY